MTPDLLEGCTPTGRIEMTRTSVAGREIQGADFQGSVEMKECDSLTGPCETSTEGFRQWKCHKCLWDPRTEDDMRRLEEGSDLSDGRRLQIPGLGGIPGMGGVPGLFAGDDGRLATAPAAPAAQPVDWEAFLEPPRRTERRKRCRWCTLPCLGCGCL
ncbi:unnamed protein product [Effrenium voratum]|uniref:Uncharacterized protein n=1 Tax=Effrenium voratum TaxID=2562239 RepID=A0AA36IYZ8_9DINO|nr:unnamed protein product [Effrenium voratum]